MKRVLLICGFYTHPEDASVDCYGNFELFFMMTKYHLSVFRYRVTESLIDVYQKVSKEIPKYDIIIAHSLGGCMLMNYIQKNQVQFLSQRRTKFIFLMPFLQKSVVMKLLSRIPGVEEMLLLKPLFIPNHKLFSMGNILNDRFELIPVNQIHQAIKEFLYSDKELLKVFSSSRVYLIYANDEQITNLSDELLNSIEKKYIIDGKHVAFGEPENVVNFFNILRSII